MSGMFSQIFTPELIGGFIVVLIFLLVLYLLSIFWSVRDASLRGIPWTMGLISIIPIVGLVAYCMIRPALLKADREEQELEIALKQRQLMSYGDCANCGFPIQEDYVMCPNCHQRLKNLCPTCHHALDPSWSVCPYCTTPIGNGR